MTEIAKKYTADIDYLRKSIEKLNNLANQLQMVEVVLTGKGEALFLDANKHTVSFDYCGENFSFEVSSEYFKQTLILMLKEAIREQEEELKRVTNG